MSERLEGASGKGEIAKEDGSSLHLYLLKCVLILGLGLGIIRTAQVHIT